MGVLDTSRLPVSKFETCVQEIFRPDLRVQMKPVRSPPSQSPNNPRPRILDVPCKACGDFSSGKHYGIYACDGCAGFFRRTIRKQINDPKFEYKCSMKNGIPNKCWNSKEKRNDCKYCRFVRCLAAGMNKDSVQQERGARKPKLPQQLALYNREEKNIATHPQFYLNAALAALAPLTQFRSPYLPQFFHMPPPGVSPPIQPIPSTANLIPNAYSVAATLLSLDLEWALNYVPHFRSLCGQDKFFLLEQSWPELFTLTFGFYINQYLPSFDLARFFMMAEEKPEFNLENYNKHSNAFQNAVKTIINLEIDRTEYFMMKMICLFNCEARRILPSEELPNIRDHSFMRHMKIRGEEDLKIWISQAKYYEPSRQSRLDGVLETLQTLNSHFITTIFFKRTLHGIPMEEVIRGYLSKTK